MIASSFVAIFTAVSLAGGALPAAGPAATTSSSALAIEPTPTEGIEQFDLGSLLNEPVVIASGTEEAKALAAANVISVTKSEIARHGWRSLGEILASVPGLYVIDDLALPSIAVRGVTGGLRAGTRIMRVMIDG